MGTQGRRLAAQDWGVTLHLEKLAINEDAADMQGVPERVIPGLRIERLSALKVAYLGPLTHLRGQTKFDDDRAFVRVLLRGRTLAAIKSNILLFTR